MVYIMYFVNYQTDIKQSKQAIKLNPLTGILPPIPHSPTDTQVKCAENEITKNVMEELENEFIFIETDQTIFTKLLNTMFKFENDGELIFEKIIPRMG